jgi:hypothetical protein
MDILSLTPEQLEELERAERALVRLRYAVDGFCRSQGIRVPIIWRKKSMLAEFDSKNQLKDGKPHGGYAKGVGMDISWQKGPLGRGTERKEPNGAFVETVIAAALQRLEFYQDSGFSCSENASAIHNLKSALGVLDFRTQQREGAGVEGTHERRP